MTATDSSEFESLIDQWLLMPDAEVEGLVRQHRVLPISADMGSTYFFRIADRQVLCCGWGPNDALYIEEPSMQVGAMVAGAKRYPQLKAFLPKRPSDAVECVECHGTGTILNSCGCGACWSLGWLHETVNNVSPANPSRPTVAAKLGAWLSKNLLG